MCVLCSALLSDHWSEASTDRRSRVLRMALVNRVLVHYGLELRDWAGRVYTLRDRKGHSVVVDDLGQVWTRAQELCPRRLDPLDPALIESLSA